MLFAPDLKAHIAEAVIAVESALALAETVALHGITESHDFNAMIVFMHEASEALAHAFVGADNEQTSVIQLPIAHGAASPAVRLVSSNDR